MSRRGDCSIPRAQRTPHVGVPRGRGYYRLRPRFSYPGQHIRGVRFYRPCWEERVTPTTQSQGPQPATLPNSGPPKPLTPDEIADRTVPSDPRISPDGSRIVFVASTASKTGEKWTRSLWIAGDGL